jgi:hypothetical protein
MIIALPIRCEFASSISFALLHSGTPYDRIHKWFAWSWSGALFCEP